MSSIKYFFLLCTLLTLSACCNTADKTEGVKKEVSVQLYSVRELLRDHANLEEVLAQLAEMGYTGVETANYSNGLFYGKTPEEFKEAVEAVGMEVVSAHTSRALSEEELSTGDLSVSLEWWDQCIADHKAAGMKYIVVPAFPVPSTLSGLQTYCEYFNEIGKRCKEVGIEFGYHNHSHEYKKIEDQVVYDYMLENTDPEYVFFQMDVYWTVRGQNSPVEYFNKYPGRFKVLHIKDHKEIGESGMVGFDAIFKNASTAGVQAIVAEIESYSYPVMESVAKSLEYLQNAPFVPVNYGE